MPELSFAAIDEHVRHDMQASLSKGFELARFIPGETPDAPPILTFRMLGDRYLAYAKMAGNQEKTLGDHHRSLRLAYAVIGADKPAASISAADVALLAEVTRMEQALPDPGVQPQTVQKSWKLPSFGAM